VRQQESIKKQKAKVKPVKKPVVKPPKHKPMLPLPAALER
jgi:hypothetical protein